MHWGDMSPAEEQSLIIAGLERQVEEEMYTPLLFSSLLFTVLPNSPYYVPS